VKTKQKIRAQVAPWALQFMHANFQSANSEILRHLQWFPKAQQLAMVRYAALLLHDPVLARREEWRNGAGRLLVAKLPSTFPTLENILSDFRLPLWFETHFLLFSALDRSDLTRSDQKRVLSLVENYLMRVRAESGFAAWKAGDMLGDEWGSRETVKILERVVISARHVAGRNGAIHGLVHAIDQAKRLERERLRTLLAKVAVKDRSASVRSYAKYALSDPACCTNKTGRNLKHVGNVTLPSCPS
jgi:hypothetical protein